ncbi:hypothetical protein BWZ31_12605, partial [Neisseria meningitidis]
MYMEDVDLGDRFGRAGFDNVFCPDAVITHAVGHRDNRDMTTERTAGWLSGSCLLVRWDAFEQIGGFDERYFMYMEDVDLGDRFGRAGFDNVFCPDAVITHAVG